MLRSIAVVGVCGRQGEFACHNSPHRHFGRTPPRLETKGVNLIRHCKERREFGGVDQGVPGGIVKAGLYTLSDCLITVIQT